MHVKKVCLPKKWGNESKRRRKVQKECKAKVVVVKSQSGWSVN